MYEVTQGFSYIVCAQTDQQAKINKEYIYFKRKFGESWINITFTKFIFSYANNIYVQHVCGFVCRLILTGLYWFLCPDEKMSFHITEVNMKLVGESCLVLLKHCNTKRKDSGVLQSEEITQYLFILFFIVGLWPWDVMASHIMMIIILFGLCREKITTVLLYKPELVQSPVFSLCNQKLINVDKRRNAELGGLVAAMLSYSIIQIRPGLFHSGYAEDLICLCNEV